MSTEDSKTFQGNPCRRGHSGLRYKCNGACVPCTCEASIRRQKNKRIAAAQAGSLPTPAEATDG